MIDDKEGVRLVRQVYSDEVTGRRLRVKPQSTRLII